MATKRRDPEQIYRDVMAKFDAQTRDRIQGVIIDYGIEKADPFFLIFLAMGHLLTLVQTAPENWQALFDEFKGDLDAWTTQNLRTLEAINQQSQISERLIRSFQELSTLTTSSNDETLKLHRELTRLNTELEAFKGSLIQAVNQNTANSQTLLSRFQSNEKKVAQLERQMTWTLSWGTASVAVTKCHKRSAAPKIPKIRGNFISLAYVSEIAFCHRFQRAMAKLAVGDRKKPSS